MEGDKGSAERIRAAAAELLAESGYEALSMRRVAAKVGLSQAAIYRHYRDKAELVASVIQEGYEGLRASLEALHREGGRPDELLAEGIRRYLDFALASPRLFRALLLQDLGQAGSAIEAFAAGVSRRRRTFELLSASLAEGMAQGIFAPAEPELTAQAVWAAMFGLAARLCLETGLPRELVEALREREIAIIIGGLKVAAGPQPGPKELS